MNCTKCDGSGFLGLEAIEGADFMSTEEILAWIVAHPDSDVSVCDCCGDGEGWHGEPGRHYGPDDPPGPNGPYAPNGGLCRCH